MAIAFDAKSNGITQTVAHTCTGNNLILVVGFITYRVAGTANSVTGVTYNGVLMTQAGVLTRSGGTSEYQYLYYLVNPSTGTNNIVVSTSNTLDSFGMSSASYTGVNQIGQPDSYVTSPVTADTQVTTTTTTIADNCWLAGFFTVDTVGAWIAGANTTLRDGTINEIFVDSNGAKTPVGVYSLVATHALGQCSGQMISISPALSNVGNMFLVI